MTSASDRREIIALLDEAMAAGARQASACAELGLDRRTVQRWRASDGAVREDLRPVTQRPPPASKLSEDECEQIAASSQQRGFCKPPAQPDRPAPRG
jgi:putative transposase